MNADSLATTLSGANKSYFVSDSDVLCLLSVSMKLGQHKLLAWKGLRPFTVLDILAHGKCLPQILNFLPVGEPVVTS